MVTQHAQNLEEDFARLRAKLSDPMFLANKGIGNEVGFFVFPYDAAYGRAREPLRRGQAPVPHRAPRPLGRLSPDL